MTKLPSHQLIQGSLSAYDPFRLERAIDSAPETFEGATLNVSASPRSPSIGLEAPNHPAVNNCLLGLTRARTQSMTYVADFPGVPMVDYYSTANLPTGSAKDLFLRSACYGLHGASYSNLSLWDEGQQTPAHRHPQATRTAIFFSTYSKLWDALPRQSEHIYQHGPIYPMRDAMRPPRAASSVVGLLSTGEAPPASFLGMINLEDLANWKASLASDLASNGASTDDAKASAEASVSAYWDFQIDRKMGAEHFHIAARATHLSRLIVGMYDFYGVRHDSSHPYLVEPETANALGFKPPVEQRQFPNPLHVQPTYTLIGQIDPSANPFASARYLAPTYQHPKESPDYGQIKGTQDCAYTMESKPEYGVESHWSYRFPMVESGRGDVNYENESAHLHHVAWGPSELVDRAHSQSRPPELGECGMLVPGYLPADQLRYCCTLSLHNADMGMLEAARHMNKDAWLAAAKMAGLTGLVVDRFECVSRVLDGHVDVDMGCLDEVERLVLRSLTSPLDPDDLARLQADGIVFPKDLSLAVDALHTQVTQDMVHGLVGRHATNILDRHPVLLHPSVVMPTVQTNVSVRYDTVEVGGKSQSAFVIKDEMTTSVMNVAMGNISLPVNGRFASNRFVRAGLGDRDGGRAQFSFDRGPDVASVIGDGKSGGAHKGAEFIPGLPFVNVGFGFPSGVDADGGHLDAYWGANRNQVVAAMRSLTSRAIYPTDFYASVLELNTHSDEFILYRDQLIEHLGEFNPAKDGADAYPAPTANPFQLAGRALFEHQPLQSDVGNQADSPESFSQKTSESDFRSLQDGINGMHACLLNTSRGHITISECLTQVMGLHTDRALPACIAMDALNMTETPVASTAPADNTRLPQDSEPIKKWLSREVNAAVQQSGAGLIKVIPQSLNVANKSPSAWMGKRRKERTESGQAYVNNAASIMRLVNATRAHIHAGAVNRTVVDNLVSWASDSVIRPPDESTQQAATAVGLIHHLGITKTRLGAARLIAARLNVNAFPYKHDIDGINLPTNTETGRALENAFTAAVDAIGSPPRPESIKDQVKQSAPFQLSPSIAADIPAGSPTTMSGSPAVSALIEHAQQHAHGQPTTLTFPTPYAADELPAGPTYANPIAEQAGDIGDIRAITQPKFAGAVCGVAAVNSMLMHGVGPLFFSPSSMDEDKGQYYQQTNFNVTDPETTRDIKEEGIIYGWSASPAESYGSNIPAIGYLDTVILTNYPSPALPSISEASWADSPLTSMMDERVVKSSPRVDDMASVVGCLRAVGAGQGADGLHALPPSVVRIGAFVDHNFGNTPDILLANITRKDIIASTSQVEVQPRTKKRRAI